MISFIFQIILLIIVTLFIGHTTISFDPFSITMTHWRTVIAMILFFVAYQLFIYDLKQDWRKDVIEKVEKLSNEDRSQNDK